MRVLVTSIALLGSTWAFAEPPPDGLPLEALSTDELKGLSLEELLNKPVYVASRREESILDVPGTVTTYGQRDIQPLGYYTLRELAGITPGYSASRNQDNFWTLETRGFSSSLGEKNLVLLDGMPINHVRNNSAIITEDLPLLFTRRVEFLRGPASALYGVGAFSGAINLVSDQPDANGTHAEAHIGLGLDQPGKNSEGTTLFRQRLLAKITHRNENFDLKLAVGHIANEASLAPTGAGTATPFRDQQQSLFVYLEQQLRTSPLRGLTLGFLMMDRREGYGASWALQSNVANHHEYQTVLPYLKYARAFSDRVRFNSRLRLDMGSERGGQANTVGWWSGGQPVIGTFQFDVLTRNVESLAEVTWDVYRGHGWIKSSDIVAGLNYDLRWQDAGRSWTEESLKPAALSLFDRKNTLVGAYLQWSAVFPVLADLRLTAGVRSDNGFLGANHYSNLSPRLALVQKVTSQLSLKAMYGTALRAPGIDAYSQNAEKQSLIDDFNTAHGTSLALSPLLSETIKTGELSVVFSTSKLVGSVGAFYNSLSNALVFRSLFEGVNSAYFTNNPGRAHSAGGEVDLKAIPLPNLRLSANASYARSRTEAGQPYPEIPILKLNLVGDYTITALHRLNVAAALKGVTAYTPFVPAPGSAPVPLTAAQTGRGTLFVDLGLHLPIASWAVAGLEVRNLTNPHVVYETNGITPFPPRTLWVTLQTSL